MSIEVGSRVTPVKYWEFERGSEEKHELFHGETVVMTDASEEHNLIVGNFVRALGVQLKGRPGKVYLSDLRVWIPGEDLYVDPDVITLATPRASPTGSFHATLKRTDTVC